MLNDELKNARNSRQVAMIFAKRGKRKIKRVSNNEVIIGMRFLNDDVIRYEFHYGHGKCKAGLIHSYLYID